MTMANVRGEGFSVRFTKRPSFGRKNEMLRKAKERLASLSIKQHFTTVSDRRERGFTFSLKAQSRPLADPIFKQLVQMAKLAEEKKKTLPPVPLERKLLMAAESGDCRMIRFLVLQGVDLEVRDAEGRTAMNIATQMGHKQVISTLLAAKEMRCLAVLGELPQTGFYKRFQRGAVAVSG